MKIRPTGKRLGQTIGKTQHENQSERAAKGAAEGQRGRGIGQDVIDIARGRAISEQLDPAKMEEEYLAKVERIKKAYNAGSLKYDSNKVAAAFEEEINLTVATERSVIGDE